jgi:hypothetical protein
MNGMKSLNDHLDESMKAGLARFSKAFQFSIQLFILRSQAQ